MSTQGSVLAVDLGGTNLRVAAISPDGRMLERRSAPTRGDEGPQSVISRMAELCQAVAADARLADDAPIGVASPGPVEDVGAGADSHGGGLIRPCRLPSC